MSKLSPVILFFALAVCLMPTVSGQNLMNGLQACYPLDCSSNTITPNMALTGATLNGTVVGNVTCTTGHNGAPGTAMQFGGTAGDYILLPNDPLIKPTTSLTIAGWFYMPSSSHMDMIFTKNTCGNNFNMNNIIWNYGQFWSVMRPGLPGSCGGGAILMTPSAAAYPTNTWLHLVVYFDNTQMQIIVNNGIPTSMLHNVSFDYDPTKEVVLGGTNETAANNPFDGRMDDLRFYDRKLTPTEINLLYSANPLCNQTGSAPTASFTAVKQVCKGAALNLNNLSSGNPQSYQWQMTGGNPSSSTLSAPSVTFATPGTYTISLVSTNQFGSSAPFTQTILVNACNTGIADNTALNDFELFPNPAVSEIKVVAAVGTSIRLMTMSGVSIPVRISTSKDVHILHVDELTEGIYIVQLSTPEGMVTNKKITLVR
jgi:PKD repeat protein